MDILLLGLSSYSERCQKLKLTSPLRFFHSRRILRLHWLPTLIALRSATYPTDQPLPETCDNIPISPDPLKKYTTQWELIGHNFDLTDGDETSLPTYTGDLYKFISTSDQRLGCSLEECPCYGRGPLCGTRKVCTGCWTRLYCGLRCQTRYVV